MGDILSKLQMVSEKIGVTETAHTIEEQVDLISESLDKIPHSTNIAEALDDLSEVAQNINNEEVYVDKTITENGTYLPASDEATAYSKVVVDVDDSAHFSKIRCAISNGSTEVTPFYLYASSNGEYDVYLQASTYEEAFLASPLTSVIYHDTSSIIFTPSNNFDINTAFKKNDNYSPIASGSDIPTAGDGKIYKAECKSYGDYSVTIKALTFTNSGSTSFNFSIT